MIQIIKLFHYLIYPSFFLFIISIFYPLFKISNLYFFSNEISLIDSFFILYEENLFFLLIFLFLFSFILPFLKYLYIIFSFFLKNNKINNQIGFISEWSMVDVFVISLIVVIYKISLLSEIEIYFNFYIYTFSLIIPVIYVKLNK